MNIRYPSLLLAFCFANCCADFSNTDVLLHPFLPLSDPFIIEITGEWPTDCHPGEQKPVIREYTGDSVLIEFETIIEHVTCNDITTPFRVLVDMSDVIGDVEEFFEEIDITVRFSGEEFNRTVVLLCICSPVPRGPSINPEAGLYSSDGLEQQGLILARQNQRMAVYPLIYDDSGSSEWLFGPGGIDEDVFFTELYELTGGQCLDCPSPDQPTVMTKVGKLSMLMDSEGLIQVKVNDGLFTTYEQIEFGYGSRDVGGHPPRRIPDLSGRWAFVEIRGSLPALSTPPPTSILPLVFDITLKSVVQILPPIVTVPPTPPGNVTFSIEDIEGVEVAQLLCEFPFDPDFITDAETYCTLVSPNLEDAHGDPYHVRLLSIERMIMTSTSPISGISGIGSGTAVRID